ncbi:MAG: translocation/assembly module TamB [Bacteroidetes bacterium]|nr:translocation/assembly module TamB [Bacteroidota bacterium]
MKNKSGNKNIKKKLLKIVLYVLLVIVIIPIALTLFFQSSLVQTISARLAADMLSKKLEQRVTINSIKIGFFSGININKLDIRDHHDNTMIGIGKLSAMPIFANFRLSQINFIHIDIDSAEFNLGSYKGEDTNNIALLLQKVKGEDDGSKGSFGLYSKKVKLTGSKFSLFNEDKDYDQGERTMDYSDILISSINININEFKIINDSLNFKIVNLSGKENSGIVVKNMSADFVLSSRGLYTNNTLLHLNNSTFDADFGMEYSNYGSFGYYIDSVVMIADIRPTNIDMADIGHFADILFKMPNKIGVTGKLNGTVSDLTGKELKIKYGENTRVSGDISIKGLPDFFNSLIVANDLKITTNAEDIKSFYLPIEEKHVDLSGIIPNNEQLTLSGDFKGYYEDFNSNVDIILSQGIIKSNIKFKNSPKLVEFKTTLIGDSVNIGNILNQSKLGISSFNMVVSGKGKSLETAYYTVSGKITKTDLLGYNYRRIGITGSYFNDSIVSNIRVGDKNLMMDASVKVCLKKTPIFTLNSEIVVANLNKLNLWSDQNISISSIVKAKVVGTDIKTLNADISLKNNKLIFDEKEYLIDSIIVSKHTNSLNYTTTEINSDIVRFKANGEYNLTTVTGSILNLFNNYFRFKPDKYFETIHDDRYVNIELQVPKPKIFTDQFLSGVGISRKTILNTKFNFLNNSVDLNVRSNRVKLNNIKFDTVNLSITSSNDQLFSEFSISKIILKDSTPKDSTVFGIDDFSISSRFRNDSIIYGINWDNRVPDLKNLGDIEGYISQVDDSTKFNISKANVYINDICWNIDSNNLVILNKNRIFFKKFYISADNSEFKLIGTVPRYDGDSLIAQFKDWRLSNFDIVTKPMNIELDGIINGSLNLSMKLENPTLVSNISITDLGLNNEYLGDAHILNTWDNNSNSIFISSNITRKGNAGEGEIFKADGYYHPTKKTDNLNIDISFNRIKLGTFEPFLSAFVDELEGTTSGNLAVRGSVKQPIITGSAEMHRAAMRVDYTNTRYSFSNSIDFVENGVKFDKLVIYDTLGNQAQINGSLTHNYFKDSKFNIGINTPGLLFFNTSEHMNDLFYGSAIASGDIKLTGSPSNIDLRIDVKTQKGTSIVLPLKYSVEISDKDYIIFTTKDIDTISKVKILDITEEYKNSKLDYNIDVNLEVTPIAQVAINLPDDMGTIEARGTSNLALDVNSNGRFTLVGDYLVEDGVFKFKIGNLVSKRFILVKGGRISWSGSPYSANVNIKGMYKVKTSLSSLGIVLDSTASYKNKVNVECYVVLTGELLNPNIKFEINIPNLDPDQQRQVFSELDTTNTAMMNQQMISLLVLGTFSFNNAANVSLQSSYYNVIANQLSSLISNISDNVDVGLNYKPGDDVSQEEFEVALSTQLFDDRLTIDGNFGMTYDRTEQSASNIVGDVDIGYKLTPDGQWVLKVFNHSNVNSYYNNNNYDQTSPYTQGVGIAFRKDFNNIAGLFASKKKKNKEEEKSNKESIKKEDENNKE